MASQRSSAKDFVKRWRGRGDEQQDTQSFWIDLMVNVLGLPSTQIGTAINFERRVQGRRIDVFIPDHHVLVEQKSLGIDLDKPEPRNGGMETPFQQAHWYYAHLPRYESPTRIVTCNFETFRVYDLNDEWPERTYLEVSLEELPDNVDALSFLVSATTSRAYKEQEISVEAGNHVSRLYDALKGCYHDIEHDVREQRSLNVLITRIVFLLYAEDAGLLPSGSAFSAYCQGPVQDLRRKLSDVFRVVDTPEGERSGLYVDPAIEGWPYVNGGLFHEPDDPDQRTVIPWMADPAIGAVLAEASQFNWSDISPTIFGAVFESTLNPETRRSGGMHYTSPENIHKVIDPLFLDDLKAELARAEGLSSLKARDRALNRLHDRLASLRFLDPACGSGNFLTETYLELRRLENRILEAKAGEGQTMLSVDGIIRVSIDQLYGIEINDFAVSVAKTALWISEEQMMDRTQELFPNLEFEFLPLQSNNNIVHGNALRMDWDDVLPAEQCSYIMGNPPFYGARMQSKEQKAEIQEVFHGSKNSGNIDYVAGWYIKAAEYMAEWPIRAAFVSTNSICQGEQVANIWKPIYDLGVRIDFAHDTFRWRNEATDQAHVFVVIVGFSKLGGKKTLFHHANPDADEVVSNPSNINAYLSTAPDVFVWNRSKPLCDVPELLTGSQRIDDNNYVFTNDEKEAFCTSEPAAERYFKVWYGADEFINNRPRWCLYLGECSEDELAKMPLCLQRVSNVRAYRESSNRAQTKRAAATPKRFGLEVIPDSSFLIVPVVSSERRAYVPIGYMSPDVICSNQVNLIPNTTLFHFGVLHSQFHNAWMRVVCGRLKSDYRYSKGVVYNNFVWPEPTDEQRQTIEACAQAVLDARDNHPDDSLATLYDPDKMPADLLAAHKALDAAVEAAYGVDFGGDEEKIVAHLFKLYAEKAGARA